MEKHSIEDPYVKEIAKVIHVADIKGEIQKSPEALGIRGCVDWFKASYKR